MVRWAIRRLCGTPARTDPAGHHAGLRFCLGGSCRTYRSPDNSTEPYERQPRRERWDSRYRRELEAPRPAPCPPEVRRRSRAWEPLEAASVSVLPERRLPQLWKFLCPPKSWNGLDRKSV